MLRMWKAEGGDANRHYSLLVPDRDPSSMAGVLGAEDASTSAESSPGELRDSSDELDTVRPGRTGRRQGER